MKKIFALILLCFTAHSHAENWVEIDDASKILWQFAPDGSFWFRNLNEFDSAQGSCCYAYRLDTTTPLGKTFFTILLAKIEAHQRITLGFPAIGSNANVQTLDYLGRHGHGTNE